MKVYRTDKIITRSKIRENPDVLYLFGDNLLRKGLGGQAKEMRGEENTIGVVTKKYPSNHNSSFFKDEDFEQWLEEFSKDIDKLETAIKSNKYRALVIPKIGQGLADLANKAPNIWEHIKNKLDSY